MQANAQAVAGFPSPEFERRITELRAAIANDRSELETAQKKLGAMAANPSAIVAVGKNPDEEIRNARAGIQALESRIAAARSQIVQLFRDEHRSFDQHRAETWKRLYEDFVKPTSDEILATAQLLNAKLREVVATVKSKPAEFAETLDSFKSQTDRWNSLVRDFGALGIGGNLAVPESDLLRSNVADAIKRVIKDNFGPTSATAEILALSVVTPWKEAPPTLAERIEERRRELQRLGEPYNP
jgi:hypothetical protein